MVLPPLEFSECYLDSPWFRENIQQYEAELERTSSQIKQLIKDAKSMLNAFKAQEKAMNCFNDRLQNFQFDCIGEKLTDDEKIIAGSLKEFGVMLEEVSTEWARTIERAEIQLIKPLEAFRKDHIYSFRESKKAFEKSSERYYKHLEHTLGLSHKKKEQQLMDSDNELLQLRKVFHQESLRYVYKLQEVQERKKFEFVEHLLMFMQVYFNYLHQTHETAFDYKDYMKELQMRLVATRERYNGMQNPTRSLMIKMAEHPDASQAYGDRYSQAGYLFLMEKNPLSAMLASKWTKYFCMYGKENKLFHMKSLSNTSNVVALSLGSKTTSSLNFSYNGLSEPMTVITCTRRVTDSIDKRFCFDLELKDTSGRILTVTLQAVSDQDRKKWMSVMDGKEPLYIPINMSNKKSVMALNEQGLNFAKKIIAEIERRGLDHQGIYRLVGVSSKVENFLRQGLDPNTGPNIDISNTEIWETNTLTSGLKSYLRNLPEPLMTFDLHREFIDAAQKDFPADRLTSIAGLVSKLPATNRKFLQVLVQHLGKVEEQHKKNKMTVQNLGVCFGPTLFRDRMESVQAIIDIKFSNILVEIMIEERNVIFFDKYVEKLLDLPSRSLTKLTVRPSQRLKQRPRGRVFDQTCLISEYETETNHFNKNEVTSASFDLDQAKNQKSAEGFVSPRSSLDSDDEFGHISPMDLNLGFDDLTPESSDPPNLASVVSAMSSLTKVTKAYSDPDLFENELKSTSQSFSSIDDLSSSGSKSQIKRFDFNNVPKNFHHKRKTVRQKKPFSSTQLVAINSNLNENNCNNKPSGSSRRVKPKTLAVTNSLKEVRKKLVATAKEGLTSPTLKSARKKRSTPVNEQGHLTNFNLQRGKAHESAHKSIDDFAPRMRSHHICLNTSLNFDTGNEAKNDKIKDDDENSNVTNDHAPPETHFPKSPSNTALQGKDFNNFPFTVETKGNLPLTAKTRFACEGEGENELSFKCGETVHDIRPSGDHGWVFGSIDGKSGLIPTNYLQFID